ncbi:unnamed protein product [Ectocarpus sp. CCAP 1310/34]|nr:unnamed protein product [Ectocarpus sp. CCAP 1310/34]
MASANIDPAGAAALRPPSGSRSVATSPAPASLSGSSPSEKRTRPPGPPPPVPGARLFPFRPAPAPPFDDKCEYASDDVLLFWKPPSVFSQWTPLAFDVLGVRYPCGEHFMMSENAKLSGDMTSYDKIMAATDPKTHNPFDRVWGIGMSACFPDASDPSKWAANEASPFDRVWGIGMSACFPDASDSSKWAANGKNLLGKALMQVRRLLRDHPLSGEDFPASNSPTPPISQPPLHGHRRIHEVATATGSSLRKDPGEDPACLRLDAPGDHAPGVHLVASTSACADQLPLLEHGPDLVGGTLLLDSDSYTTRVLLHGGNSGISLGPEPALVEVNLVRSSGMPALIGEYLVSLKPEAGCAELEPGDVFGVSAAPLLRVQVETLKAAPSSIPTGPTTSTSPPRVNAVGPKSGTHRSPDPASAPPPPKPPPQELLDRFSEAQRSSFMRLWARLPAHMHDIAFDLHNPGWTPEAIDRLADALVEYSDVTTRLPDTGVPRVYVPMLMRPWVLHACHTAASFHLGVHRTQRLLERFYWWIGLDRSDRWWLRACLVCQARKTSRQTARWPVIAMPLPQGPGTVVGVDFFGPLPVTAKGNSYILLFTDRFSRRADMFAVTAAEFTARGTAHIFVNQYMTKWGCPTTLLSDNGLHFCSKLSMAIYEVMKIKKVTTSSYHPQTNGGTERVNHTMAQMLAVVVNEQQNDWDIHLPHVEFAYNNSVNQSTGLAPNEIHIGRIPRLPLSVFDRPTVGGHQSLARDQLEYCNLAGDRQRRAYELVREYNALKISRVERRNSSLLDAIHKLPQFTVGGWAWVYNTAATIRQGV